MQAELGTEPKSIQFWRGAINFEPVVLLFLGHAIALKKKTPADWIVSVSVLSKAQN